MPRRAVIHVVPHTHWDREWYEPFEAYRFELVKMMDRLLEVLDDDPSFRHFHLDGQTAAVEDYLEIRPPVGPEIERFIAEGRLAIGPWRILMDEFLCSPETLVRNLQQGLARAQAMGATPTIGYIPDSFGHVSQMPQILRLAGMTHACVWRGVPYAANRTAFDWEAPDGTSMRTLYLATSYSNGVALPETVDELLIRARRIAEDLAPFSPGEVVLAMNGSDHRGPEAHLPALFEEANRKQDEFEFRLGTLAEYLPDAPRDDVPRVARELRSGARANLLMGVASARMPLKQAEFRAAVALERYAEPLAVLARADFGRVLDRAWRAMVENSAHDSVCGCGIDAVAEQVHARYVEAERLGNLVARESGDMLASRIDTRSIPAGADGIVFLNPSVRPRGGVHEVTIAVPHPGDVSFAAHDGSVHAVQLVGEPTRQVVVDMTVNGTQLGRITATINSRMIGPLAVNGLEIREGRQTEVLLHLGEVAEGTFDVEAAKRRVEALAAARPRGKFRVFAEGPPLARLLVETPTIEGLGWTVLAPRAGAVVPRDPVTVDAASMRNELLEVVMNDDGTVDIVHRPTGTRYERALGFEDGGDAGDEYNFSPPGRDTIVTSPDKVIVEPGARGPLEASFVVRRRLRVPTGLAPNGRGRSSRTVPMDTVTTVALRSGEPFLRVTMSVDNRAKDHRLRVVIPLPFRPESSHAESAFAVVARGREAESGPHEFPLPTFPCRRWVDAGDGRNGIAVVHAGTPEYELTENGLAVTLLRCVGWLSRGATAYRANPAGPLLETPGAQLLGEHRFDLALVPHAGDWRSGAFEAAESFSIPFRPVVVRSHGGELTASGSALRIEPASVQPSAVVAAGEDIDVRVFNASDDAVTAVLHRGAPMPQGRADLVDLLGEVLATCDADGEAVRVPLRAWEIATVRLRRDR
jgi:alpha-mannosidase